MKNHSPISMHGTMVQIGPCGVLLTGEPAIGKSQLALGLIDRGHYFISDDSVNIVTRESKLMAQRPSTVGHYLCIRGIGLIEVPKHYPQASLTECPLDLIIHLSKEKFADTNPLLPLQEYASLLDIQLPKYILSIDTAINLPLIVETLVHQHCLNKQNNIFPQFISDNNKAKELT